jgi:hypothetical protein
MKMSDRYIKICDDVIIICGTMCVNFVLVTRVISGPCQDDMSVQSLISTHCNPSAAWNSLPYGHLLLTSIAFLALQKLIAKGASRSALILCWIICFLTTNICLYLVKSRSSPYYWVNLITYITICISYEIERNSLTHFIHAKVAQDAVSKVFIIRPISFFHMIEYLCSLFKFLFIRYQYFHSSTYPCSY